MRRSWPYPAFSAILFCFLLSSCKGPSSGSSPASPAPSAASNAGQPAQAQAPQVDPCGKFSAADAQSIMGVPMKVVPGHGANVCMYDEASPKSAVETARVSLMLNVRGTAAEEDRAWNNIKVIRRLSPGEKNIAQLSGIGDEAWFDGNIQKGKVGVGGVIVRKGRADFMLDSAVLAYRASAEQMKSIAKKVADGLE
jgi:Protein of unknown function (DUF3558)